VHHHVNDVCIGDVTIIVSDCNQIFFPYTQRIRRTPPLGVWNGVVLIPASSSLKVSIDGEILDLWKCCCTVLGEPLVDQVPDHPLPSLT
jgi:hypothetical protein